MNTLHTSLFRRAKQVADNSRDHTNELKEEILRIDQQKAEALAAFELAKTAADRLDRFEPEIGRNFRCPVCWVRDGTHSKLRPIPSKDDTDWFRCGTCHVDIAVK